MPDDALEMFTVYWDPADCPGEFVARSWLADEHGPAPGPLVARGATLAEVRQQLPPGLYCIPRAPQDDYAIVEVWL